MFRGTVKGTGDPLHSPVSLSLPLPCVTVCHHIATGVYLHALALEAATPTVFMDRVPACLKSRTFTTIFAT